MNKSAILIKSPIPKKIKVNPMKSKDVSLNSNDSSKQTPRSYKYIEEIVCESAAESTTHGLPHIIKRKNLFVRLVWAACFFISAVICSYMIAVSIMNYFEYETVTKAQRVQLAQTEFPAISICNMNSFMTNKSYEFTKSVLGTVGFNGNSSENMNYLFDNRLRTLKLNSASFVFIKNLTDEEKKSFGYDLNETMLSCTFNLDDCTANQFEWFYDIIYGNCYKFNGGKDIFGEV